MLDYVVDLRKVFSLMSNLIKERPKRAVVPFLSLFQNVNQDHVALLKGFKTHDLEQCFSTDGSWRISSGSWNFFPKIQKTVLMAQLQNNLSKKLKSTQIFTL